MPLTRVVADTPAGERLEPRLGEDFLHLAEDRASLVILLHLFSLGRDPGVGPTARRAFLRIHELLRERAGLDAEAITALLVNGMLIITLLGLDLPAHRGDPAVAELIDHTFRENSSLMVELFAPDAGTQSSG